MTKKTTTLGISLAAIMAIAITFPITAEAISGLVQTEIKTNDDTITKLRFHVDGEVEPKPFGGYAIFTDAGAVVAVTSHAGFYDSETQTAPNDAQIALDPFPGKAAVCNVDNAACGPEWHTHLVEPITPTDDEGNPICSFAAVGELTWDEPSASTKVAGENLILRGIAIGDVSFEEALGGSTRDFTTGTPVEGGVAFDLNPVVEDGALKAVCIGPPA